MTGDERDKYYLLVSAKTKLVLAGQLLSEARNDLEIAGEFKVSKLVDIVCIPTLNARDSAFKAIEEFVDDIVDRDGDT